jgi:electron transport complex protein RnfC
MECGWERIQKRLAQIGRLDVLKCPVQVRNYATDEDVKK